MIIYNIRKNGPYEKDKWLLNIYQLHNLIKKTKTEFKDSKIHKQLENLKMIIQENCMESSMANKIILLEKEVE